MDTIINVHYLYHYYHYTLILGYKYNDTEDTMLVNTEGSIKHDWGFWQKKEDTGIVRLQMDTAGYNRIQYNKEGKLGDTS